ncbi:MAG TPA: TRAM domain-containing protein [Candidatus Saccharimonadales bacterium]|nr:TRAM domain-containing protein [Candidatus Saccharimonadales bacterium]
MIEVEVDKLVHGGQGLGVLPDGRKVFVWGALPGERVNVRILKGKRSYAEAIAEEVLQASPLRIEPREPNYLATSPWQIIPLDAENDYKKRIVEELFTQAHVALPAFNMTSAGDDWHYRNKMEYSFWGDDDGLHLALHNRGSHRKSIVKGSELALPAVDRAANVILAELQKHDVRAGDLKTIIVRCSQDGAAVVSLFVKPESFVELQLPLGVQGLRVYHSNPKSPASVPTALLQEAGECQLRDTLLGKPFVYDGDSFFQVNLPVFEAALQRIKDHLPANDTVVDMYAGTGSIGLSVAASKVDLVELDPATAAMARVNAEASGLAANVVEASTEKALEYITPDKPVIFDPPRAGLHDKVVAQTLEALPPKVVYLSCNPATQARDLAKLSPAYETTYFASFNFFPHTPHIETLAVLERRP